MISKRTLLFIVPLVALFSISMIYLKGEDTDYEKAILIAEQKFSTFKVKREDFKLIEIKNDILKNNGHTWKLTYLVKRCISEGIRDCLGGETYITVDISTGEATVASGE
jgi:hypothetical protein